MSVPGIGVLILIGVLIVEEDGGTLAGGLCSTTPTGECPLTVSGIAVTVVVEDERTSTEVFIVAGKDMRFVGTETVGLVQISTTEVDTTLQVEDLAVEVGNRFIGVSRGDPERVRRLHRILCNFLGSIGDGLKSSEAFIEVVLLEVVKVETIRV